MIVGGERLKNIAHATLAAMLAGCATVVPYEPHVAMPHPYEPPRVTMPQPYTDHGISIAVDGLWRDGYGNVSGVSGMATNDSGRELTLCQITLDVLDSSGVKVSGAVAVTNGLKVGQKWRFQATLMTPYTVYFKTIAPGSVTVIPRRTF